MLLLDVSEAPLPQLSFKLIDFVFLAHDQIGFVFNVYDDSAVVLMRPWRGVTAGGILFAGVDSARILCAQAHIWCGSEWVILLKWRLLMSLYLLLCLVVCSQSVQLQLTNSIAAVLTLPGHTSGNWFQRQLFENSVDELRLIIDLSGFWFACCLSQITFQSEFLYKSVILDAETP